MKTPRIVLAAVLVAFGMSARATTFATDVTDLWWNSSEGGWGVNVIHQGDTLFITFFVYAPNGTAIWYSASDMQYVTSPPASTTYTGELFQTSGPWLGGAFDPKSVVYRKVGTATFVVQAPNLALLTYSVDGVTLTNKVLTRYTFRDSNMSGIYRGVLAGDRSNCTNPANNGPFDSYFTSLTVSHSSAVFSMQSVDQSAVTCTYSGGYSQTGKLGVVNGGFSCTDGRTGPFQASEVQTSTSGFIGRFAYSYPGCTWNGRIAAAFRP